MAIDPKSRPRALYSNSYMTLFDNGTIGLSDGVGYVDTLGPEQVRDLYNAIGHYYYASGEDRDD